MDSPLPELAARLLRGLFEEVANTAARQRDDP